MAGVFHESLETGAQVQMGKSKAKDGGIPPQILQRWLFWT